MKLKEGFVTHTSAGEHVLLSTSRDHFNGLVRCNGTAAFIVERLKVDTTVDAIVDDLLEEYDVDRDTAIRAVENLIGELKKIGALEL